MFISKCESGACFEVFFKLQRLFLLLKSSIIRKLNGPKSSCLWNVPISMIFDSS